MTNSTNFEELHAFSSGIRFKQWWEWTLVALIGASGLIGILAFVWTSYNAILKLLRVRSAAYPEFTGVTYEFATERCRQSYITTLGTRTDTSSISKRLIRSHKTVAPSEAFLFRRLPWIAKHTRNRTREANTVTMGSCGSGLLRTRSFGGCRRR